HHETHHFLPDGGEYWDVPNYPRSMLNGQPRISPNQNWGWCYQILPFIEQSNTWSLPSGQEAALRSTLIPLFFCPSRRAPMLVYDSRYGNSCMLDYAGNAGVDPFTTAPRSGSYGNGRDGVIVRRPIPEEVTWAHCSLRVRLHESSTPDGTSNTLLLSEKCMNVSTRGQRQDDDDQGFTAGWDWDEVRWGQYPPTPDHKGSVTVN